MVEQNLRFRSDEPVGFEQAQDLAIPCIHFMNAAHSFLRPCGNIDGLESRMAAKVKQR